MKTYKDSEDLNQSDTEITLGMRSILGIFFGLALICGVFFGFGYSLGRGNPGKSAASSDQSPSKLLGSASSPEVKTVVEGSSPDESDVEPGTDGSNSTQKPTGAVQTKPIADASAVPHMTDDANGSPETGTATNQPQAAGIRSDSSLPSTAAATPPHLEQISANPSATIMVQIAAVSHREDAAVLVSALNKLGYSASVRSESTDQLLHVQVGPFITRNEANAMRIKLLNDGYNAIVK